jgi:hypothetical protein
MYLLYHVILLVKYARASETTWVHISCVATGGTSPPPHPPSEPPSRYVQIRWETGGGGGGGNTDPIFS